MRLRIRFFTMVIFVLTAAVLPSTAQQTASAAPAAPAEEDSTRPPYKVVTNHTMTISGKQIAYSATVEEIFSLNDQGERTASLVSISYVRTDSRNVSQRPVIFAFNGGPGSASLWQHLGLLGPCRVLFQDTVSEEEIHPKTTPPFLYGPNPDCLLDLADIVLFDPPGTGFSRVLGENNEKMFYGVEQDARVTCEFIEDWVDRNGRWNSPKFLMGESYGTVRAAVVSRLLTGGPFSTGRMEGITLNGVILLGQAMNIFGGGTDIAFPNVLPTLAATAWYHGKVNRENKSLEQHVDDACVFAANDYVQALYAGSTLSPGERSRIADRLSALTGLSQDFILEKDLRVDASSFAAELLKSEGNQVGLYDGRFTLPLNPSAKDPVADDPAMAQYVPAFVATLNEYLKKELHVDIDRTYNAIEFKKVNAAWDYGFGPGIPASNKNYAEDLAIAMRRNPNLRVLVGTGYFDLVTTLGSAYYTISHVDIERSRVSHKLYRSGHMPYIGASNRRILAEDLRQFITDVSGQ
jgi:carboxypeptidase C (cathepsin A)